MQAVQLLRGQGGWPLNVFCLPDGRPFFGGTYFPPDRRMGMAAWPEVLEAVSQGFRERRDQVVEQAGELVRHLATPVAAEPATETPDATAALAGGASAVMATFDERQGGFGGPTQVPPALPPAPAPAIRPRDRRSARARPSALHPAQDGRGRYLRPARRRLPPLLRRRAVACAPLREDALRQRPARPALPRRLAPQRRRLPRPHRPRHARLLPPRHALPRGRLLLQHRRRLRGRRGQVLRLDPGRHGPPPGRGRR